MDYNAKISDTEAKYFTASDYNKFTSEIFETKIKEKGLVDNSRYVIKSSDLNTELSELNKSRIKSRAR